MSNDIINTIANDIIASTPTYPTMCRATLKNGQPCRYQSKKQGFCLVHYKPSNGTVTYTALTAFNDTCPVCLEDFGTCKTKVLKCHHAFHPHCVNQWLAKKPECPMCKAPTAPMRPIPIIPNHIAEEEARIRREFNQRQREAMNEFIRTLITFDEHIRHHRMSPANITTTTALHNVRVNNFMQDPPPPTPSARNSLVRVANKCISCLQQLFRR